MPNPRLLVATTNPGKAREFRALLPESVEVLTLSDLGLPAPEETGDSFAENARLKALAAARGSGLLAIADDSGFEIAALGGAPGVRSARYAGEDATDEANREKALAAVRDRGDADRSARFVAAVAVAQGEEIIAESIGVVDGVVTDRPRGSGGFGYDPMFELPDGRTMAELSADEKNAISHRSRAYREVLPALLAALGIPSLAEAGRS